MLVQIVLLIAALLVSWLLFTLLINIVKTTVKTAILIAAIVLVLQLCFGIGPQVLVDQIKGLPQIGFLSKNNWVIIKASEINISKKK